MFNAVNTEKIGEVNVVSLRGQFIGGDETDSLRQTLKSLHDEGAKKVIVDMENVTYLNSTALGSLISAHSTFAKSSGKIVLSTVGKNIENIFIITKLTLVFDIAPNREEALTKFNF